MSSFAFYPREFIVGALQRVPFSHIPDVYVVSLVVYDEHEDPLRPTATVGFNAEGAVRDALSGTDDPDEVRRNFAVTAKLWGARSC